MFYLVMEYFVISPHKNIYSVHLEISLSGSIVLKIKMSEGL